MRRETIKNTLQLIAVVFCLYIYYANAETVISSVRDGIDLCYNTVIPSLFIFMIICNLIAESDYSRCIATPFMPYFRLLNINDKRIASLCVLGIAGGFATGAVMLDKINNEYNCSTDTLKILALIMSLNSPSFVILAAGLQYIGNIHSGMIIYFSGLISTLVTAFVMSFFCPCNIEKNNIIPEKTTNDFITPIKNAVNSVIYICGVVIFTSTICKVLSLYITNLLISGFFSVFCEVTAGCDTVFSIYGKNIYWLSFATFVLPLSAFLQIKSIGSNFKLQLKSLVLARIAQLPVAFVILRVLLNLFPYSLSVYANGDVRINLYWNSPQLSLCLFLLAVCFLIFLDKKAVLFTKSKK